MSSIERLNEKATQTAFNKKVVSASQQLHPYVKHRLYIAESTGIIPKKMYASNGIIDESIAKFYEKGYDIDIDTNTLKLKLFKIVDADLDAIFKKEAFHKNTISTNSILVEELDALEENYTIDDGFDYVMNEDLDDISYQQNGHSKHLFLYDDDSNSVLNALDTNAISLNNHKKTLGNLYSWLPLNVSNIVDLFVFGKLSFEEISKIKSIETKRIVHIFDEIKKNFNNHID
ncbi:hypothetical protein CJ739_3802 [Mariniflexile rhizosphaerae]|uniref:hypothetical protein n=1 Tax=unclassified Mariniflexile TaxID=2643887 RepID=UPI000CAF7FD6|nr:hypothetical protein [Mariniflexile sp. TRM1-10]AXP82862.1 hypothetical protein CJ739_3802 [Mariniflexile sp. TRM1-10]PLB18230.1 MAG: hypothetical protein TRG1_2970 [Flavobacteriaceae bacterium FS1-H7996/R]